MRQHRGYSAGPFPGRLGQVQNLVFHDLDILLHTLTSTRGPLRGSPSARGVVYEAAASAGGGGAAARRRIAAQTTAAICGTHAHTPPLHYTTHTAAALSGAGSGGGGEATAGDDAETALRERRPRRDGRRCSCGGYRRLGSTAAAWLSLPSPPLLPARPPDRPAPPPPLARALATALPRLAYRYSRGRRGRRWACATARACHRGPSPKGKY